MSISISIPLLLAPSGIFVTLTTVIIVDDDDGDDDDSDDTNLCCRGCVADVDATSSTGRRHDEAGNEIFAPPFFSSSCLMLLWCLLFFFRGIRWVTVVVNFSSSTNWTLFRFNVVVLLLLLLKADDATVALMLLRLLLLLRFALSSERMLSIDTRRSVPSTGRSPVLMALMILLVKPGILLTWLVVLCLLFDLVLWVVVFVFERGMNEQKEFVRA